MNSQKSEKGTVPQTGMLLSLRGYAALTIQCNQCMSDFFFDSARCTRSIWPMSAHISISPMTEIDPYWTQIDTSPVLFIRSSSLVHWPILDPFSTQIQLIWDSDWHVPYSLHQILPTRSLTHIGPIFNSYSTHIGLRLTQPLFSSSDRPPSFIDRRPVFPKMSPCFDLVPEPLF